jgi:hypothetical protein
MSEYESAEIAFVKIGNRIGLTARQLRDNPELADFVKRFPDSFEPAEANIDAVLYTEPHPLTPKDTET